MVEQVAALVIGEDASRIEHLWQLMYRAYFYPPGREKIHAQGAIDMARIYLRDGKDPEMRRMAEKIIADQVREIAEMRDWLTRHPAR